MDRLRLAARPEPTLDGLRGFYAAWCRSVPFDNVRKLIHVRSEAEGPLPGGTAEDFFQAWLRHGTGGTCWAGAGALHAMLVELGFAAERGVATMLAAPELPPNHGTVRIVLEGGHYLVDSSILHGEPLRLSEDAEVCVEHAAWGVRGSWRDGRLHVWWRPLHLLSGFECRLERFGAEGGDYRNFYERTRGWSPFNYEVSARLNRGDRVVGLSFGHAASIESDGSACKEPTRHAERVRVLIEELGMSEEIVSRLPEDVPTPPPPGSRTAAGEDMASRS